MHQLANKQLWQVLDCSNGRWFLRPASYYKHSDELEKIPTRTYCYYRCMCCGVLSIQELDNSIRYDRFKTLEIPQTWFEYGVSHRVHTPGIYSRVEEMLTSFIFHLFRKKTRSSPLSTYVLNMTYAESFDVSYMVYINTFCNIMEETISNGRIKNNELGVELRKIKIKLGSFMLFASLYQEW